MGIKKALTALPPWILMEADYAQLEIRVLALATRDVQLIHDIRYGLDLHRVFAAKIFNKDEADVSISERKIAKGFSFQLQYGAGAKSIAEHWNVDIAIVKRFIKEYYARYPQVQEWQNNNITYMKTESDYEGAMSKGTGVPTGVKSCRLPSIWPQKDWGDFSLIEEKGFNGHYNFPPTKIKNYPIQGGAADIMLLMLNHMRRKFLPRDDISPYLMFLNTVHDSFVFGVDPSMDLLMAENAKKFLESVPKVLEDTFGISSPVPFPVDVSIGPNWEQQKTLDL